jgi:hypothetical protein
MAVPRSGSSFHSSHEGGTLRQAEPAGQAVVESGRDRPAPVAGLDGDEVHGEHHPRPGPVHGDRPRQAVAAGDRKHPGRLIPGVTLRGEEAGGVERSDHHRVTGTHPEHGRPVRVKDIHGGAGGRLQEVTGQTGRRGGVFCHCTCVPSSKTPAKRDIRSVTSNGFIRRTIGRGRVRPPGVTSRCCTDGKLIEAVGPQPGRRKRRSQPKLRGRPLRLVCVSSLSA